MNDLVKVQTTQDGTQVVSARDLHQFVVVEANGGQKGEDFTKWIKRMLEFGFKEGLDYVIEEYDLYGKPLPQKGESDNQAVRVHKREYILTLDTAKHIAMVQKNDKGEQARRYFIECESKLKSLSLPDFTDPAAAAIAWANEYRAKQQLAQQNENLQIALDSHLDWLTILSVAKLNNVSEKVFDWRRLTERSRIMGYEIKKTTCPRFGYRNNYHLNVFRAEYPQYSLTRDKQLL